MAYGFGLFLASKRLCRRERVGMEAPGYPLLFGESGAAFADADWIDHANKYLPPNLSALNTTFVDGSRAQRSLRVSYEPGPSAFNFAQLSGGSIAEMLDQAATHCGSFVTSHPCPTLSMNVTFLRAGTTKSYVATGRLIELDQRHGGPRRRSHR